MGGKIMVTGDSKLKGATSWITYLEKLASFFKFVLRNPSYSPSGRHHPCLVLVYYYFFGVFLP